MRVNVYVDGLNLYYGALRGSPYRWLDLCAFSTRLLQRTDTISQIHYFTARVAALPNDLDAPERQATYLRALGTLPEVQKHFGRFLSSERNMPLADGSGVARVIRTEEKGSDVNLASYLLLGAHDADYEAALVISNDSDLLKPIEFVRTRFGLPIGIAFPVLNKNTDGSFRKPSFQLRDVATFERLINDTLRSKRRLAESQFANPLTDAQGSFWKPAGW